MDTSTRSSEQADLVYIYSSDCYRHNTSYHNDVTVTLPRPITTKSGYNLFVSVYSLSIPLTQSSINMYNNVLTITGVTVTLEPGHYSASMLAVALQIAFPSIVIYWNPTTTKITFQSPTTITLSGSMCVVLNIDEACTLTGGTTPTWTVQAHHLIQSLTLSSSAGSSVIESLSEYGAVHSLLRDLCSKQDLVITRDTITQNADPTTLRESLFAAASGVTVQFSIPLLSIISALSGGDRYLAFHKLAANPRLDIEWAQNIKAISCTGAPASIAVVISSVSLDTTYVTLSGEVAKQIDGIVNGEYVWSSSIYKNYRSVMAANQLSLSAMVPSRVESAKSLMVIQRVAANEFDFNKYSIQDRVRNYLSRFQTRSGSRFIDSVPVGCTNNALGAYLSATRLYSNPSSENSTGLINLTSWTRDAPQTVAAAAPEGSFLAACDLESFSNSQKLISGVATQTNSLIMDLTFSGAPLAVNVDCVLECDAVFSINAGQSGAIAVAF
ncbi:hypothetical protein JKP88DRAFT_255321 [Tribonema minus]|uniref:Uncharacterized protein n=1 Tax=Tribonema minus TaxID=303371 RepID=A0A836CGU1_9STRA|nr:hypothetical protein JKP88DRAFT_255321 [Tribonema minus]